MMKINEVKYDENHTQSLINNMYIRGYSDAYAEFYNRLFLIYRKFPDKTPKQIFKDVFGKQQICVTYSRRNWVWTFSNGKASIWALISTRGISWENDPRCDFYEVKKLLYEIIRELEKDRK